MAYDSYWIPGQPDPIEYSVTSIFGKRVLWVPKSDNGLKDMSYELETLCRNNQGCQIVCTGGTILLRGFGQRGILKNTDSVDLEFGITKVLVDNDIAAIELDNTSNASEEVTVSAVVNETINVKTLSTKITIATTLDAKAHDWIALYSEDANPSKSGGKLGEIHQLIQDESSLDLNTVGLVCRSTEFTDTVRLRKLDASRKVRINGGVWTPNGNSDDLSITDRNPVMTFIGFVDPVALNVKFNGLWAQGVQFRCCAAAIADTYEVGDSLQNASANGYSYGVMLYGMNGDATVKNGIVRNCRHPAATTDGNNGNTTTWYAKGYPTYFAFLNTRGYNCYGSVLDTHEEGFGGIIDGLVTHNGAQDQSDAFVGRALQSRSAMETIKNVVVTGGAGGISFGDVDHGFEDQVLIENITIRGVKNGSGGSNNAIGIDFNDNDQTNLRHYRLNNATVEDTDRAVMVGENNRLTYNNLTVSRSDALMLVRAGAEVTGVGKTSGDFRDSAATAPSYFFMVYSAAGNEPSIRLLEKPIVLKGASNAPAALFHEADTTANKNVWHPGIVDFDGGFTATTSKSSGASTFVDLTDINLVAL